MSVLPVGFGSAAGGGTPANAIERSLRFNSADTAYLNRTFTTPTSAKKFTISAWIKVTTHLGSALDFGLLCGPNSAEVIGISGTGAFGAALNGRLFIRFGDTNLVYYPQIFRDVSAWGHIVVAIDTDQAVQADRAKFYYNGVLQTATSSAITSGYSPALNTAATRYIGSLGTNAGYYANGYLTEYNFIDGQALTPSSFGETDTNTGVWKPKAYTGTYGTNGFYVNFSDNSGTTSTTLGKDSSGNGNNWTPNNFSVTAGVGNDSLVDSPTSYGTDTGVGGEVRGNYCTMNPLTVPTLPTLANGNLDVSVSATGVKIAQGTFQFPSSGKWYYECTFNNASSGVNGMFIGITSPTRGPNVTRSTAGAYFFYASTSGLLHSNGTDIVTGLSAISANEVFKLAVDIDNSKVWIGRGSIWYNSSGGTTGDPAAGTNPTFSISAIGLTPMSGFDASSVSLSMNFGQRSFNTTAPSGFKALCTQNLTTPTIGATSTTQANDYMNVVLYTGNGTTTGNTQAITGVGFQPDFVWLKSRSNGTYYHLLNDAVRGANKVIYSNNDLAETTVTNVFNSFDSDGFTVAYNSSYSNVRSNENTVTYVGWNWKANGAGSTNSNGTAKSSSVTVDSSTDTVTWNSHGMSDGQKIGFFASVMPGGLSAGTLYFVRDAATNTFKVAATSGGAAIDITSNGTTVTCHTTLTSTVSANTTSEFSIITYTGSGSNATIEHGLDIAPTLVIVKERPNTDSWLVWQSSISAANYLVLNSTASSTAGSTIWNSTAPTSKVFSVGTNTAINQSSQTYIAYCFAPVAGYSAFGSYESNNSTDGPFIYLGFRARWIMFKRSSTGTNGWAIYDTARNTFNATDNNLHANSTGTENSVVGVQPIDVTANGIKIRTSWSDVNGTGTYIYAAFAENPFKYSLAR